MAGALATPGMGGGFVCEPHGAGHGGGGDGAFPGELSQHMAAAEPGRLGFHGVRQLRRAELDATGRGERGDAGDDLSRAGDGEPRDEPGGGGDVSQLFEHAAGGR